MIGIAVIGGAGGVGRSNHLPGIRLLKNAQLVAICDINEQRLKEVGEEYNVDTYTDIDEMLKQDDIQMVDIASTTSAHVEQCVKSLEAGKHVLCEKPMSPNVKGMEQIVKVAEKTGLKCQCAQSRRYYPRPKKMKAVVNSGEIGVPVFLCYSAKGSFWPYPKGHYNRSKESGGTVMMTGSHCLDFLCWIANSLPKRVYAVGAENYSKDNRMESKNYTCANIRLENGAAVQLELNSMIVNSPAYPGRGIITIIGTKGGISYDSLKDAVITIATPQGYSTGEMNDPSTFGGPQDPFAAEITDFVECIINNSEQPIPLSFTEKIIKALCAVNESIETGRVIEI